MDSRAGQIIIMRLARHSVKSKMSSRPSLGTLSKSEINSHWETPVDSPSVSLYGPI